MTNTYQYDVLIIGSGAAGLSLALRLPANKKVAVLSKGSLTSASTYYAQGGVAAVLDKTDSLESHVKDTLDAGAGLCHKAAVEFTVNHGPDCIQWLIDQGVAFTQNEGSPPNPEKDQGYHLTKEGGHSHRRVIHAADATGLAISQTLIDKVRQAKNVDLFENRLAVDLITLKKLKQPGNACVGAYILDLQTEQVELFRANNTVLATGGASKAYLYTSNPDVATGDGIAMAWRAGCRVANMEFNQFHPTCLYHPQANSFLITEAVRGEGGKLLLPNGQRFMDQFDPRAELAPRDIVARAIDHEMKRLGEKCLYLDISHKGEAFIKSHFPTIYDRCLELGLDITKEPMPIVPAAHYTCGGVMISQSGETDVKHLYAVGESTFTGLHGANRMASNSLLECFVYAFAAADHIAQQSDEPSQAPIPAWDESQVTDSDEDVVISHNWDELRRFMWDYVGIVRTDKRLYRAKNRIELLQREITEYYSNYKISNDLIELRNLVLVAELIVRCALMRKESRGLHYTLDYPDLLPEAKDSVLVPPNSPIPTAKG